MSNNEEFDVPGLYIFPYSGHCSHSELVRFISFLKPRDVQPIIKFMTDEHSVIPQCIYKLCLKESSSIESQTQTQTQTSSSTSSNSCSCKSASSPKFFTCEAGNSQKFYSCDSHSTSPNETTMIPVLDSAQKQELIDNAINELKSFNDVDDFLENVSDINNVSNFGQDVSESAMTISTIEVSGNLHESLLDNLLSTSGDPNDMIFYTDATPGPSDLHQTSIQSPNSSSPVQSNHIGLAIVPEITNLPISKTSPVSNTKAFYKSFDSTISTSCAAAKQDQIEKQNRINDSSHDEVHWTNTYADNDIAENVISSTNNDCLPEIIPSPAQQPVDKNQGAISVTVGDVNIDIRSDLDLQDMSDKDDASQACPISHQVRVQHQKQPLKQPEIIKTYEEKSIQTDLTLETLAQLEKSREAVTSHNEAEPLVIQNEAPFIIQNQSVPLMIRAQGVSLVNEDVNRLIAKYVSKNKRTAFDMNRYYEKCCNKHDHQNCSAPGCQECRTQDENAKKRKVIKNTLYNSAMTMETQNRFSNNFASCNHLIGYNMLHPMYKS